MSFKFFTGFIVSRFKNSINMISINKAALIFFLLCFSTAGYTQSLKKYAIGNTGCSMYSFCEPDFSKVEFSEDSSAIYKSICDKDEYQYGIICVQLLEGLSDLSSATELGKSYCDYLKTIFEITESAGYGDGHQLNNDDKTTGFIDYWKDKDGAAWKIKCWTNGSFIAFLFITHKDELPSEDFTKQELFLNGFRFAGQ